MSKHNLQPEQLSLLSDLADGHSAFYVQDKHSVSRDKLYQWLEESNFDQEYVKQLNITTQVRLNSLIQHVDAAVKELGLLLTDEKPEVRLRAIEIILKHSDRIEKINLNHRLNKLLSKNDA